MSGMLVHSTLMVDAHSREPLGLIDQQRWSRPITEARNKPRRQKITGEHKKRADEEKESVKWEQSSHRMSRRAQVLQSGSQLRNSSETRISGHIAPYANKCVQLKRNFEQPWDHHVGCARSLVDFISYPTAHVEFESAWQCRQ